MATMTHAGMTAEQGPGAPWQRAPALAIFALGLTLTLPAWSRTIDQLIVAGDSLSDPGNVYRITSSLSDAFPFLLDPIPDSPPYFEGRFSNGPVWAERLGVRLGLPGEAIDNLALGGANTSGSTALNDAPDFVRPSLEAAGLGGIKQQVDSYLAAGKGVSPNSLAVVWGGANDYLFGSPTITVEGLLSPVANLRSTVLDLADSGVRQFLVPNLPDLGRIPSTRGNPTVAAVLSDLTQTHNVTLAQTLTTTATARGLDVEILDVAGLFEAAFAGSLGFANVTTPCIDAPATCGTSLFFDGVHPTATAHALLGDIAYDVVATPLPPAAGLLVPALVGLAWMRRRSARARR